MFFKGLEGARGWLALTVVFSHLSLFTPVHTLPGGHWAADAGHYSVMVFIIVSGFVITNLVIGKREPYRVYIARRALRIFPAYLVALAVGIASLPAAHILATLATTEAGQVAHIVAQRASLDAHWPAHLALHLTLFHGAVPNNILMESQYMFVPPAWSLSLEWQFYLIAPAVVWGAVRRPFMVAVLAVILYGLRGQFGHFYNPSFLPGAGWYFLIGIGTRLGFDRLPEFERFPWAVAVALAPLLLFSVEMLSIVVWLCLVLYMRSGATWWILDGKPAQLLGERSYSIYILHFPLVLCSA